MFRFTGQQVCFTNIASARFISYIFTLGGRFVKRPYRVTYILFMRIIALSHGCTLVLFSSQRVILSVVEPEDEGGMNSSEGERAKRVRDLRTALCDLREIKLLFYFLSSSTASGPPSPLGRATIKALFRV